MNLRSTAVLFLFHTSLSFISLLTPSASTKVVDGGILPTNGQNLHTIEVSELLTPETLSNSTASCDDEEAITETKNSTHDLSASDEGRSYVYLPHRLAQAGKLNELKILLTGYPQLLKDRDSNGWTLMHEAARGGHVPIAEYLVFLGADMNTPNNDGLTPLLEAHRFNGADSPICKFMESYGALLESPGRKLRGRQDMVKNFAHTLAGRGRLEELKKYVESQGTEILKAPDQNGWTLFHEATRMGQIEMAIYLLEQGADVNQRTVTGHTALQLSQKYHGRKSNMSRLLMAAGAH